MRTVVGRDSFRVALIGDYSDQVVAHRAIPKALELAGAVLSSSVEGVWCHTSTIIDAPRQLAEFDAVWCVPASPYANMNGVLAAIQYARETSLPFLGTCGGFQHAVIEYARNVRLLESADHAESNPAAATPVISALSCSLKGASQELTSMEGSRVRQAYGAGSFIEEYHCSYGMNREFADAILDEDLWATAHDDAGEVRAIELRSRPFFVATLFQPERRALKGEVSPLVVAFVTTMMHRTRLTQSAHAEF